MDESKKRKFRIPNIDRAIKQGCGSGCRLIGSGSSRKKPGPDFWEKTGSGSLRKKLDPDPWKKWIRILEKKPDPDLREKPRSGSSNKNLDPDPRTKNWIRILGKKIGSWSGENNSISAYIWNTDSLSFYTFCAYCVLLLKHVLWEYVIHTAYALHMYCMDQFLRQPMSNCLNGHMVNHNNRVVNIYLIII